MRKLLLTGLANEFDLENPEEPLYLLVFNKGELRVPVQQETAQAILHFMSLEEEVKGNGNGQHIKEEAKEEPDPEQEGGFYSDEDEVVEDGAAQF